MKRWRNIKDSWIFLFSRTKGGRN